MAVFLIAYDILNEGGSHDYEPLWQDLKKRGGQAVQDGLWLAQWDGDAGAAERHVRDFLDQGDRLLVTRLRAGEFCQSRSRAGTDDWLAAHVPLHETQCAAGGA